MNKYVKTLLLLCILGIVALVLILERTKTTKNSNPQKTSSAVIQGNNESTSFIEKLRQREYVSGKITIEETLSREGNYTSYIISYPSDDLKIYGMMNVPDGEGPIPVVVLNHGYFNQTSFSSGDGTHGIADILAAKGYITFASDYRGFGKSENDGQGSRGHRPEYAIDVLNLIASVKNLDKADVNKIGMWGHSMGGEVALRVAEATDKLKAIILWAPTSDRVSDNASFYGGGRRSQPSGNIDGASPINYLQYISSPVSLHQGLADTEVNPQWSKELNEALQKEAKTVEYFEYEGQDHNFRNLGWDVISKRTIDFFDRYLKSDVDGKNTKP